MTAQGSTFDPSARPVPPPRWEEQFLAYRGFLEEENRRPSQYGKDAEERNLFYWHRHQISSLKSGLLLPERMAKLNDALPGWNLSSRRGPRLSARREQKWQSKLEQLAQYVHQHGRHPGVGPSRSPEERSLGKWLSAQRRMLKKGTLYPGRLRSIDELIQDWRKPAGNKRS